MKVYEVECRAVITLAAEDIQKAALYGAAVIKDNAHLIYVRAVHERNLNQFGKNLLIAEAEITPSKRNPADSMRGLAQSHQPLANADQEHQRWRPADSKKGRHLVRL